MRIFGREPTVVLQSISALLSILVVLGPEIVSPDQQPLVVAFIGAVFGLLTAVATRPWAPGAFIALATSGAALVTGYGIDLDPRLVGAIVAALPLVLALQTRAQVTPRTDSRPADQIVG